MRKVQIALQWPDYIVLHSGYIGLESVWEPPLMTSAKFLYFLTPSPFSALETESNKFVYLIQSFIPCLCADAVAQVV